MKYSTYGFLALNLLMAACGNDNAAKPISERALEDDENIASDDEEDTADLEMLRDAAYKDGYADGHEEGFDEGVASTLPETTARDDARIEAGVYLWSNNPLDVESLDADLLGEVIGDASLVGLGETVHLNKEIYDDKIAVFKAMVENHGFRYIFLEESWSVVAEVGDFLQMCEPTELTDFALAGLSPFWDSQSFFTLLEYICLWNTDHPNDHIVLGGSDARQPYIDTWGIVNIINENNIDEQAAFENVESQIFSCVSKNTNDVPGWFELWDDVDGDGDYVFHRQADHDACVAGIDRLYQGWSELTAALSDEALRQLEMHLYSLEATENEYYHRPGLESCIERDGTGDWQLAMRARTYGMGRLTYLQYVSLPEDSRAVFWASTLHTMRNGLEVAWETSQTGQFLHRQLGKDYRSIAFSGLNVENPNADGAALSFNTGLNIESAQSGDTSIIYVPGELTVEDASKYTMCGGYETRFGARDHDAVIVNSGATIDARQSDL